MSADTETITNGELSRAVVLIRNDISEVKRDVSSLPTTRDISFLEKRIADLEDWQKWAVRIGVPALIGVVVNLVNTIGGPR